MLHRVVPHILLTGATLLMVLALALVSAVDARHKDTHGGRKDAATTETASSDRGARRDGVGKRPDRNRSQERTRPERTRSGRTARAERAVPAAPVWDDPYINEELIA